MSNPRWVYRIGVPTCAAAALVACSSGDRGAQGGASSESTVTQEQTIPDPLVATYDGGLYVLDGQTLEVKQDIPLDGFLRVNPAGDERHVLVTSDKGFQVLDAAGGRLTDEVFPAVDPGHVVAHGEHTVLFADGTGDITAFDPHALSGGVSETEQFTTQKAHHGVAVILGDGTLVHSLGDPETRTGAVALQGDREIARNEDCPGIHGESVAADEVVVLGCENGVLTYTNGAFTKIASPTPYGRIGNTRGHEDSPVVLGDMKVDAAAELERPQQFALIDTSTDTMKLVQLPPSVSYWFRSLGRGPQAEALVLGTDGTLYVHDAVTGDNLESIPVTAPWTEPDDWQQGGPAVFTRGGSVYVSDPAAKKIHLVDIQAGTVTASGTLTEAPNELSGAVGHQH